MIFVVSPTLVNLGSSNPWETTDYFFDIRTRFPHRDNIVNSDSGALNNRATRTDSGDFHDISIAGRNHPSIIPELEPYGKNFLLAGGYSVFVTHVVAVMVELADTLL